MFAKLRFMLGPKFPVNYGSMDLNFMGFTLVEGYPQKWRTFSLAPYLSYSSIQDKSAETNPISNDKIKVGVDGKLAITNSLNLDLTFNPDFSNADTDEEITNISRF